MKPLTIIAEAGVNHDGDLGKALALVDVAADAKADVVKFQIFDADSLASSKAALAPYQQAALGGGEGQGAMLRRLQLSRDDFLTLWAHCVARGVAFSATPFDPDSLAFLVDHLAPPFIKIGSGDLTNAPLLLAAVRSKRPIILSTGMATKDEVRDAIGVLGYGLADIQPDRNADFGAWMHDKMLRAALSERVTLLHCTTAYPTPLDQVNLAAMVTLKESFGLSVGFSDHTVGWEAAAGAVAMGASVIEKHFTLDKSSPGPDHKASLEPDELAGFVTHLREMQMTLGDGEKRPCAAELENVDAARRCLVAGADIKKGEIFSEANLAVKRPNVGLSPMEYWRLLGRVAKRDYPPDSPIDPTEVADD